MLRMTKGEQTLSFFGYTVFKHFIQPPRLVILCEAHCISRVAEWHLCEAHYIKRDAEWHIPRTSVGVTIKFSRFVVEILCRLGGVPLRKNLGLNKKNTRTLSYPRFLVTRTRIELVLPP